MSRADGTAVQGVLNSLCVENMVKNWLLEDSPSVDYAGFMLGNEIATKILICSSEGILAGKPFFNAIFKELNCTVEWQKKEGDIITPICSVATIRGKPKDILDGERVAVSCICRASGIATMTNNLKILTREYKWLGSLTGSRNQTPGFGIVEKYAVVIGGGCPHSFDQPSRVVLEDSHVMTIGGIEQAVRECRELVGPSYNLEVICRDLDEAMEAAGAGADIVLLDNLSPEDVHKFADPLKQVFPNLVIEASGGIDKSNIHKYLSPNVDIISLGLSHGYPLVNFSMKTVSE